MTEKLVFTATIRFDQDVTVFADNADAAKQKILDGFYWMEGKSEKTLVQVVKVDEGRRPYR